MSTTIMFAVDLKTEEVIVSNSAKGSNTIQLIERVHREHNTNLYDAVVLLTNIINADNPNIAAFKAMDKVCQILYNVHKEIVS